MLNIYSDRERTKPCDLINNHYDGKDPLDINAGDYYIVNEDSSNPEKVKIYNDSKVYAYGEGVHVEAYGNSCVTLFNGAVATLHDSSMLMLDHNDPNNGYSEGGFRVYRDLRDEGMVGSFMCQLGSDSLLCKIPKWAASPIWGDSWFLNHQCILYTAFRGGDERSLYTYDSFETKTVFEYESNEDIGFKVRLRDKTDKEYLEEKQAREESDRQMRQLLSGGGPITFC